MDIRDQDLLARLRTLGSKTGAARALGAVAASTEDALGLLGLPEQDLTPSVRSALGDLIAEAAELRKELVTTQLRLAELDVWPTRTPSRRSATGAPFCAAWPARSATSNATAPLAACCIST